MEIAIDQLNLHLNGENISSARAQQIANSTGVALTNLLRMHTSVLGAMPADYAMPSLALPTLHVSSEATNDTIAQTIANALSRAILRELDIE